MTDTATRTEARDATTPTRLDAVVDAVTRAVAATARRSVSRAVGTNGSGA